jgi:hypothetical protein
MKQTLYLLSILFSFACVPGEYSLTVQHKLPEGPSKDEERKKIVFAGAQGVVDLTDTTAKIFWPSHDEAVRYKVSSLTHQQLKFDLLDSSQSSMTLLELLPETEYVFQVQLEDKHGKLDENTNKVNFKDTQSTATTKAD